ncbi:MAG: recombinase family protein [Pseudomonadota bacterium]|nr:recombinase family protein [Pseudomonadota bacterium]
MKTPNRTACAYYRTSSATNVGSDKDSLKRQQDAVRAYCGAAGIEVVREFYDAAVSGADPVDSRPGFCEMVAYMLGDGARTVLVETANRFARDLIVQETGHKMLKGKGIELVAVDSPDSFVADTPTADFIRQVLGAVAQLEKAMLVSKLRGARDRKRRATGRCEGNPAFGTIPQAAVQAAKAARIERLTLRAVSARLAANGLVSQSGLPYSPSAIRTMLRRV